MRSVILYAPGRAMATRAQILSHGAVQERQPSEKARIGSGRHGGRPDVGSVVHTREGFKAYVSARDRLVVVGPEHDRPDTPDDGLVVGG